MILNTRALSPDVIDVGAALRRSIRVLWRGKALVAACILLAIVPTGLYLQQAERQYTAETRIMVEAPDSGDALSERRATRPYLTDMVVYTEADLVGSTTIANRVIEKLKLEQDPEFNAALRPVGVISGFLDALNPLKWFDSTEEKQPTAADIEFKQRMTHASVLKAYTSKLNVSVQRRSFVIVVRFTSADRKKAAEIANAVASAYVVDRLEASFEDARRVTAWLGERLDALRKDALVTDSAVEAYRNKFGLRRKSERQNTVNDQQMTEVTSRIMLARADLAQKRARLQQIQSLKNSGGDLATATDVLQSPLIQRLREQEAIRQREMSEALKAYGERHPRILGLRADLAELNKKIADEIGRIAASVSNEVEVAAAGLRTMEGEMSVLRGRSDVAGEAEVQLRELEREAEAAKTLYEAFLGRFKREAASENVHRASARVISEAGIPSVPSAPAVRVILFTSALLGICLGVVLVFVLDRLDNTFRSADEVEELTGVPTMAMIPRAKGEVGSPVEEFEQRPRSALADAIRSLRTAVEMERDGAPPKVILVTSSVPHEGKTFVATGLGAMLARGGHKVLIIDCDVHRARMHTQLALEDDIGLAQVLRGEVGLNQAIRHQVAPNLSVLTAGRPSDAAELIRRPDLAALVGQLKSHYDRIIIDSPPVMAVADSRVLAGVADRLLYLVKWNSTPRDAVRNGMKLLAASGAVVTGVVLSQVNMRKHARYGYGDYGQYYSRYKEYYGE